MKYRILTTPIPNWVIQDGTMLGMVEKIKYNDNYLRDLKKLPEFSTHTKKHYEGGATGSTHGHRSSTMGH